MLSAMQALVRSEGLRNGTLADWVAINRCMSTLNDCVATGQAPNKALRNNAWSKAVDGCISTVLQCYPSAIQIAISRSDAELLSYIGRTLSFCICTAHSCLNIRPVWLRLEERPHGLQLSVEALISVAQRIVTPTASSPLFYENIVILGLAAAINLNESVPAAQRLGEGLLVSLHCMHLKVSHHSHNRFPCTHA